MTRRLELTRAQILTYRRTTGSLDERLPRGPGSLRRAAASGLQDSMPRAALLSLHVRVAGIGPDAWEDDSLAQLWGPRFGVYVVAARDRAVFSLGRLPDDDAARRRAEDLATRLDELLDGEARPYGEAGRALGVHPNELRYAAPTGRVLIRWDGARQPTVWTVPRPDMEARDARLELARRYLHTFAPSTAQAFAAWAGIPVRSAAEAFAALEGSLAPVRTPIGDAWVLASDEESFTSPAEPAAPARLLPSGDAYFLLWGPDRDLLVEDPARRRALWPSRVWPGALLVEGEIVGTWRRARSDVRIRAWRRLPTAARHAVEAEAASLPLPGLGRQVVVHWDD